MPCEPLVSLLVSLQAHSCSLPPTLTMSSLLSAAGPGSGRLLGATVLLLPC